MSFNFNLEKRGTATVKLTGTGLVFNGKAVALLGAPKRVNIGLDTKNKRLAVKVAKPNDSGISYGFATTERRKKWVNVSAAKVRRAVIDLVGNELSGGGITYFARLLDGMLVIDLKEEDA
jgi:hypothetical protein